MITPRIQQVLDDLTADTTVEWELVNDRQIRTGRGNAPDFWCCPISWLCQMPDTDWALAAQQLQLTLEEAREIVWAADSYRSALVDQYLRQELLRACRLSE